MSESTSIKLQDGLKERVRAIARSRQRSANWVMNAAISRFVEHEETEADYRAEAERRLQHMRETGEHVTNEEALEWLLRRSRGEMAPVPKAHR
ncbi:MAG: CopG family transcriptional regulator [Devosia sp.]